MNHEELDKLVRMCVAPYKVNKDKKKELYQVGYLACLEALHENPNTKSSILSRICKTAIHQEYNLGDLPVSVPKEYARAVSLGTTRPNQEDTLSVKSLKALLDNGREELREGSFSDTSFEEDFLIKDMALSLNKAMSILSDGEKELVDMRFYQGLTLDQIGSKLRVSNRGVQYRIDKILEKLRGELKWEN